MTTKRSMTTSYSLLQGGVLIFGSSKQLELARYKAKYLGNQNRSHRPLSMALQPAALALILPSSSSHMRKYIFWHKLCWTTCHVKYARLSPKILRCMLEYRYCSAGKRQSLPWFVTWFTVNVFLLCILCTFPPNLKCIIECRVALRGRDSAFHLWHDSRWIYVRKRNDTLFTEYAVYALQHQRFQLSANPWIEINTIGVLQGCLGHTSRNIFID